MSSVIATPVRRGKAALDQLYRGRVQDGRPLVFLDFDDVFCLNNPYGGYDVFQPTSERPADLWERLFDPVATGVLLEVVEEHDAQVVITTSWLRLMERDGFEGVFARTGLTRLTEALHPHWEAPPQRGDTRHRAIERWLHAHYEGQPLVVLDDPYSGSGLAGSKLHKLGHVVLCEVGRGLHAGLLPQIRRALRRP